MKIPCENAELGNLMGVGSVNGEWVVSGWWCHLNVDSPEDESLGGKRE